MLVITTTMRLKDDRLAVISGNDHSEVTYMVDWIHSNTTGLGPRVSFDSKLMFCARRLCKQNQ